MRSIGVGATVASGAAIASVGVVAATAPAKADAPAKVVDASVPPMPAQPLEAKFKRKNVLYGGRVPVTGVLLTRQAGRRVLLQVNKGHGWDTVARARTAAAGRFRTSFRPHGLGRYRMRVRLVGPAVASSTATVRRSAVHTRGKVTVYRQSVASWYGPGFIGGRTACGGTLSAGTLGVANKTLPCGTRVTFHYGSHTVTARVVDRGPYVAGREWDLTPAVKARLHFPSTGTVWSTR
ncbi:MAG TPA: septal ring lytic transglycosylase RlpA family protein [Thermoleophilaceae bacterium]|nr:septal ring lytic transglycosylase RlpA family protein [Thermoleophilaceae bacterium]